MGLLASSSSSSSSLVAVTVVLGLLFNAAVLCHGGISSSYRRVATELNIDMPVDSDTFYVPPGENTPQQVHITQGDHVGTAVIVSWITPKAPGFSVVRYWSENSTKIRWARGTIETYRYFNYTSGYIHHANISNLEFNSKYYYKVGAGKYARIFWFVTPPAPGPDVPYTFGLIGDLGQTYDSSITITHYQNDPLNGQAVLFLGDLSYADDYPFHDNVRWDTWGRLVERSAAYQPWIWTVGNHEIDWAPQLGEPVPFVPFSHRYHTPYEAAGSTAPFWYSIKRGPAHVIIMAAYSAFGKYSPQYSWFNQEIQKVNRSETPWLIVIMHPPTYNSYQSHYMEGEPMRAVYENTFVKYKVDIVFAGHVHAYERSIRVSNIKYNITNGLCNPVKDLNAPVYLTVGDGGNLEGLSTVMTEPQPNYSAFREPSFGHGMLEIKNRTHAYFAWHRNDDGYAVVADSVWLTNRFWYPTDDSN
ncbi:purple acid phosphatase 2-like [Corylus avellana]|uniref:purple acid phosphatase 2-like n=1 Tax=Corylus avellana TaxID=13451 RepID=UPI00286AC941|nr:purple acid phosphatase 2-like [Corylus avellana]